MFTVICRLPHPETRRVARIEPVARHILPAVCGVDAQPEEIARWSFGALGRDLAP